MNLIYIYEGKFKKGEGGYDLIKAAAGRYCSEMNIPFDPFSAAIEREKGGKPYFKGRSIEFSLTHSGSLWMCMFSQKACGIDLQIEKGCEYEKISRRMFSEEECHYVDLWGLSGFFDVWVRKEAFVKLTGQGLYTNTPSTVSEKYDLLERIEYEGSEFFFKNIEIADSIKCAVCTQVDEDFSLRIMA